jgi:hypothetical protein
MSFSLSLTSSGGTPSLPIGEDLSEEPESYFASVRRACEELSTRTTCRFILGGFGKADWEPDVGYDLSTFIEELPDLATAVRAAEEFELNLYGQGVEQVLNFSPNGAHRHHLRIKHRLDPRTSDRDDRCNSPRQHADPTGGGLCHSPPPRRLRPRRP